MSIFTAAQMSERIDQLDHETAKQILKKIISMRTSEGLKAKIYRAIAGMEAPYREKQSVKIGKNRTIPFKTMDSLISSPMMDYIEELIMAALDPRGPYQSREIMMLADQLKGGGAPFITANGIPQSYKNQAGHILTMAGFERQSHYDKARRMPVKAWKSAKGWGHMTVAERVNEVLITLQHETKKEVESRPEVKGLLGSYL